MPSKTYMLFKGTESNDETESAALTVMFSTDDTVDVSPDGQAITFANKDGSAGLEMKTLNGARLREICYDPS